MCKDLRRGPWLSATPSTGLCPGCFKLLPKIWDLACIDAGGTRVASGLKKRAWRPAGMFRGPGAPNPGELLDYDQSRSNLCTS